VEELRRVLVAAVLGPQDGEDGELECVRVSTQELLDPLELPVGETERAVKGLFDDGAQEGQCIGVLRTARGRSGESGSAGGAEVLPRPADMSVGAGCA
jgi:hypothetical protein